ncbi:MAG: B12-binding domain-containing radical SAM protein, partial [Nanoarchaeota archaeon]|nr:B12-binding domain-containing radical SAM protein [Nanoarchaeota archaeon]MBU1849158.1 B12-binding domain-containing radical SAM protein [Nanoarchaeota archaeon]
DIIVIGEGEETFKELVESFENKKKDFSKIKGIWYKKNGVWWKNIARKPIENLNQFEFPAFHMLEMNKYFDLWHSLDCINPKLKGTNIVASRGCPYNCSYCQPTLRKIFGNKYRIRSPENVVAELKELKKRYEINTFFLHDDTFTIYKDWVKKFCDLLKKEKLKFLWSCNSRINNLKDKEMLKFMHESGLRMIHIGIESGSQRILDEIYNKGINISDVQKVIDSAKDIGIKTLAFFMLGAPGETEKEIKQTIKFAVSLNATEITATITTPLPGTKLYDMIKDKYKISDNFSDFDYYNKRAFEDPKLPYNKLKRYQRELLFRFYIHPKRWGYILKHLITLKGWKKMILKVKRFL